MARCVLKCDISETRCAAMPGGVESTKSFFRDTGPYLIEGTPRTTHPTTRERIFVTRLIAATAMKMSNRVKGGRDISQNTIRLSTA